MRIACLLFLAMALPAQEPASGHAPLAEPAACLPCHKEDGPVRWAQHRHRPCSEACLTCHAPKEMAQHHPVGSPLRQAPATPLHLGPGQKVTCATCHDLARPREDGVRWKAESLYGRLFRRSGRHRTYLLVQRNDRGQLCLACH